MPNVAFFTLLDPEVSGWILEHVPAGWNVDTYSLDIPDQEKIDYIKKADFLLLFPEEVSNEVLKYARHIKLVQLLSAGYDLLDIGKCNELKIPVANVGGANAVDVAEYAVTLMLSFYRHIIDQNKMGRTGDWNFAVPNRDYFTILGKNVGIVGLGKIGKHVAKLVTAFGANVIYYDVNRLLIEQEEELSVTYAPLEELVQKSDIISLHTPLTPETKHLIGINQLAQMKPTALLVNTCRGDVIDEQALIIALQQKKILGAALDVLSQEPPPMDHPIRKMNNVILTPHIAGRTRDTYSRRGEFVFQNMQRVWEGELPLALVTD